MRDFRGSRAQPAVRSAGVLLAVVLAATIPAGAGSAAGAVPAGAGAAAAQKAAPPSGYVVNDARPSSQNRRDVATDTVVPFWPPT